MRLAGATNSSYTGTFNGGSFNANGPYTLAFWALPATAPPSGSSSEYRVSLTNSAGGKIEIALRGSTDVFYRDLRDSGFGNTSAFSATAYTANTFNHWALTFDGSTWTLYRDAVALRTTTGSTTGRAAFDTISITTDADPSSDFTVAELFLFDTALTTSQIITVRRGQWPVVGVASSHVFGWWRLPTNNTGVDRSQTNSPFTTGTFGAQTSWIENRFLDRSSWWRRVILPQYMLQPPQAATSGNITNAPDATLSKAATVGSVASATSNCPSVTLTFARTVTSTAAAVTDAPSATLAKGASVSSTAPAVTDAPSAAFTRSGPAVASIAATVSNAPSAALTRAHTVAATAAATSDAPTATIAKAATVSSTAPTVTDIPSAAISNGLGSISATVSDAPAATFTFARTASSTAAAVSDAPSATLAKNHALTSTAAAVSDCPTFATTQARAITSTCAATSNCPAVVLSVSRDMGTSVAAAVSSCLASTAAARAIASACQTVTNCPDANVVPLIFLPISSIASTRSDCPTIAYQTLFVDVTAPALKLHRPWPPRPR